MQYTLSNDNFEVIVDSKGCEIVSVIRKSDKGSGGIFSMIADIAKGPINMVIGLINGMLSVLSRCVP